MTGLSLGNLNAARYSFRTDIDVSFRSESFVSIRRIFDVNSPEMILPKFSLMVPSTASGLNTAGPSRALSMGINFRSVRPDLEDKRSDPLQVSAAHQSLLSTDRE